METFWSVLKREIAWIRGSIHFNTRDEARVYLSSSSRSSTTGSATKPASLTAPRPSTPGPSSQTHNPVSRDRGQPHALIESTNTKLRLLTRMAYGFKEPEHLIALAYLDRGGHRPPLPGR